MMGVLSPIIKITKITINTMEFYNYNTKSLNRVFKHSITFHSIFSIFGIGEVRKWRGNHK